MEEQVPEMLNFDDSDWNGPSINDNSLKLDDPPQLDEVNTINLTKFDDNKPKNEYIDNFSDNILDLSEPPTFEYDEKIEINTFAQFFIEPIVKKAIVAHTTEICGETNQSLNKISAEKNSNKSSSDESFEYLKKEEVLKEEISGGEIFQELKEIVFKEQMKLEFESNAKDSFVPSYIERSLKSLKEVKNDDNLVSLIRLSDSITPFHKEDENLKTKIDAKFNVSMLNDDITSYDSLYINERPIEITLIYDTKEVKNDDNLVSLIRLSDSITPFHKEDEHLKTEIDNSFFLIHEDTKIINMFKDIIKWKHPLLSATIFISFMFIELGLMMGYFSLYILGYSGILLLIICCIRKIAVIFKIINNNSFQSFIVTFNKEDIEQLVKFIFNYVDFIHKEIKSIVNVESYIKNFKVIAMFYALTYVGHVFNLLSLIFIGTMLIFTMSVVYTFYEKELNLLVEQILEYLNKIKRGTQGIKSGR